MKFACHICTLLCLINGIASFTLRSRLKRSQSVTVIFDPDVPEMIANFTEVKESAASEESDGFQTLTPLEGNEILAPHPPPPTDAARMARFIVHYSLWGSLSHISHQPHVSGSPLARVYSISDGPIRSSTGVPYFYLTPNDPELQDMFRDPRASLTLTLAQTPYCRMKSYDPEDPRCAQVILTGKLVELKNSTAEWLKAEQALFSRHPVMRRWPDSHHWICCKLDIMRILVADNFGGNKYPSVEEYFRAHPEFCSQEDPLLQMAFY